MNYRMPPFPIHTLSTPADYMTGWSIGFRVFGSVFEASGSPEAYANTEDTVMAEKNGGGSDCVRIGFPIQSKRRPER